MGVHQMAYKQAMMYFGGGVLGSAVLVSGLFRMGGSTPHTITPEWRAATKEYLRFQQMNPVGIGGRKTYDPEYLQK